MLWVSNKEKLRMLADQFLRDNDKLVQHVNRMQTEMLLKDRDRDMKVLKMEVRLKQLEEAYDRERKENISAGM